MPTPQPAWQGRENRTQWLGCGQPTRRGHHLMWDWLRRLVALLRYGNDGTIPHDRYRARPRYDHKHGGWLIDLWDADWYPVGWLLDQRNRPRVFKSQAAATRAAKKWEAAQ